MFINNNKYLNYYKFCLEICDNARDTTVKAIKNQL